HVSDGDGGGLVGATTHVPVATSHVLAPGHAPHGLALGSQLPDEGAHTAAIVPSDVTSCAQRSDGAQSASVTHNSAHASSPPICAHAPPSQSPLLTHGAQVDDDGGAFDPASEGASALGLRRTTRCGQPARGTAEN